MMSFEFRQGGEMCIPRAGHSVLNDRYYEKLYIDTNVAIAL